MTYLIIFSCVVLTLILFVFIAIVSEMKHLVLINRMLEEYEAELRRAHRQLNEQLMNTERNHHEN